MALRPTPYHVMRTRQILLHVGFGLLAAGALYVGAGGWAVVETDQALAELSGGKKSGPVTYEGVTFSDIAKARRAIEEDVLAAWFPWMTHTPAPVGLLICAVAFGWLGGVARTVKEVSLNQKRFDHKAAWVNALLGGFAGLFLLGISVVIPAALAGGEKNTRPGVLLFLCLFGGMFADKLYPWFDAHFNRLFARSGKEEQKQQS